MIILSQKPYNPFLLANYMLKLPKDNPLLIILVLMLLGFIIRIYSLATQSLWIDEGFSLNAALSILKHGVPLMDSGSYYLGYLLHTYLLSLFILIFRNEIFAGRFLSVLFGTLTIPLTYYLGKEIVNKKVGLFAAVLVTFSIWEIAWSRQARMYAQFQFFYLLSLLFFYRFIQNKEAKTLALTVLFTLLTVLSHTLGYTLFLIYFIYLLVYREYFRLILTKLFKIRRLYLIIIPLFLFIAYTAVKILFSSDFLWMNYFSSYIYYMKKTSPMFLYLGIIGSFLLLKKNLKSGILLFLSILIPFLFISYLVFMIHYRYLFPIIPLLFISTAVTIDYIALLFKKKIVIALIIIVLLFGVLFNGFVFIPKKEYDLEKATPQPNFEKAYNYVKKRYG